MFPLAAVGLGLNVLSTVGGLLGANAAARRAQQARDQAMMQMNQELAREYSDTVSSNRYNTAAMAGGLGDALQSTGRALGSALAQGGVYNSSAAAGALANQGRENATALSDYAVRNRQSEQRMLGDQRKYALGLQLGQSGTDLGHARDQQAGTFGAVGNILQQLPSFFRSPGKKSSVLDTSGGSNLNTGQFPGESRMVDPVQSNIQSVTAGNRSWMMAPNIRETGSYINGNQGAALPDVSPFTSSFRKNLFSSQRRMLGGL